MRVPKNYRWAVRRSREVLEEEGLGGLRSRSTEYLRKRGLRAVVADRTRLPRAAVSPNGRPQSVVMIAAEQPPQCYHYRVRQKEQVAQVLGVPFRVVDPADVAEVFSAVQLAGVVIVFRQSLNAGIVAALEQARRLGVPVVFEADDVVYRRELVTQNPNMASVPRSLRRAVESGSDDYLRALKQCDHVLASTPALAGDMQSQINGRAFVMDNGIDHEMLEIVAGIEADPAPPLRDGDSVVIGYGSGSLAHDSDLAVAADGLAAVMAADERVRLHLMGTVALPAQLKRFEARVQRSTELPYGEYLRQLAACDITIAPLVDAPFNQYKSQVKYLEAGILGVPLVASSIVYGNYIDDGLTGLIADPRDWQQHLKRLVTDPALRRSIAAAAAEHVRRWDVSRLPTMQFDEMLAALQ